MAKSKAKPIVIKCPVAYAFVKTQNRGKYVVDLSNLDEKQQLQLAKIGLQTRTNNKDTQPGARYNRGEYITAKTTYKPTVKDSNGNTIPEEDVPIIGDGSICKVVIKPYNYTYEGEAGVAASLEAIMIVDLVEVEAKERDEMFDDLLIPEEDGGFTVNKSKTTDNADEFDDILGDEEFEEL